jgi:hypothetical protein
MVYLFSEVTLPGEQALLILFAIPLGYLIGYGLSALLAFENPLTPCFSP